MQLTEENNITEVSLDKVLQCILGISGQIRKKTKTKQQVRGLF